MFRRTAYRTIAWGMSTGLPIWGRGRNPRRARTGTADGTGRGAPWVLPVPFLWLEPHSEARLGNAFRPTRRTHTLNQRPNTYTSLVLPTRYGDALKADALHTHGTSLPSGVGCLASIPTHDDTGSATHRARDRSGARHGARHGPTLAPAMGPDMGPDMGTSLGPATRGPTQGPYLGQSGGQTWAQTWGQQWGQTWGQSWGQKCGQAWGQNVL